MITEEGMRKGIGILSMMKFFPAAPEAKAAVIELMGDLCRNDAEVLRLAKQVSTLHREWPGPLEVRAAMCGWTRPKDGIEVYSGVYPDGIPSVTGKLEGEQPKAVSPGRERLQIAGPREPVKPVDPIAAEVLAEVVANVPDMPKAPTRKAFGPNAERVDKELRRMMGEYQNTERPPQIITEADFEAIRKDKVAEA